MPQVTISNHMSRQHSIPLPRVKGGVHVPAAGVLGSNRVNIPAGGSASMDLDVLQEAIKGNAALAAHFETKRLSWKDLAMLDATVDIETDGSTVLENPDEPDLTKTVAVEQGKPKEVTHTVAAAGSATVPSAPAPKAKAGPKGGPKATK